MSAHLQLNTLHIEIRTARVDEVIESRGEKGALNLVVGTNEDFSGLGSRSFMQEDRGAVLINIAKQGDNENIMTFEFVQVLTTDIPNIDPTGFLNALKDTFIVDPIVAALEGTDRSHRTANIITFGGISEMQQKARRFQVEPKQEQIKPNQEREQ